MTTLSDEELTYRQTDGWVTNSDKRQLGSLLKDVACRRGGPAYVKDMANRKRASKRNASESKGTQVAAKARAQLNEASDTRRQGLLSRAMGWIYGSSGSPVHARRA